MPATSSTPSTDSIVCEIEIAAPPARVFDALTKSDQLLRWFTDQSCPAQRWDIDGRKGGRWRFATDISAKPLNGVSIFRAGGEILEFDPPRLLVYTWHANWHDDPSLATIVRYELQPVGEGTKVRVTHSGLANESLARADYNTGWPGVLTMLKTFSEKLFF